MFVNTGAKVRVAAEFRKNKDVTDKELLKNVSHVRTAVAHTQYCIFRKQLFDYSDETERYLRQNVVQATLVGENIYSKWLT